MKISITLIISLGGLSTVILGGIIYLSTKQNNYSKFLEKQKNYEKTKQEKKRIVLEMQEWQTKMLKLWRATAKSKVNHPEQPKLPDLKIMEIEVKNFKKIVEDHKNQIKKLKDEGNLIKTDIEYLEKNNKDCIRIQTEAEIRISDAILKITQ